MNDLSNYMEYRDIQYEKVNIDYNEYPEGGIKCKNYELCRAVLPPDHQAAAEQEYPDQYKKYQDAEDLSEELGETIPRSVLGSCTCPLCKKILF